MILVDANLLLYAYDSTAEQHEAARAWLERTFSGSEPVRLPWVSVLAFVRIGTNARALKRPLELSEAIEIVSSWLARPNVAVLNPGDGHWALLARLAPDAQARGPLFTDAHLAALAIEHGATLATNDRDFARFDGLRIENPLAAKPARR